ncbi:MAG: molecular chaperone TorD family protein [SAR324 cluster bacterium]|nr:molecular chaperone TorD family protein [SAR324 cluster bacterium]
MTSNDLLSNYTQEINPGRRNIYDFLARVFAREVSATFLKKLRTADFQAHLTDLQVDLEADFLTKPEATCLEDLAVEYARLFLGPGKHISPHESVHYIREDGDYGSFWGKSTVEVKNFIEATGLEFQSKYTGMPDHISVEFELMRYIVDREAQAIENNNLQDALYCLKMGKKFIDEHLAKWNALFCDKVSELAELPFYREMAKLSKWYVEYEVENIDKYIELLGSQ